MDENAVDPLIARLKNIDPSPSLVHLSLAEYAFISQNQAAAKWMSQDMADELIPAINEWVNDQLLAVYTYLERQVSFAFDQIAAHNVEWAGVPIEWDQSFEQCDRIQRLLCRGLPFLCSIARSKTDYFKRYGRDWMGKDLRLAERRKKDIYNAGGRGCWPKGGLDDFSGITNIRDRRRGQLIQKWKRATENGEDEDPLES
ncbi:hypothetical protein NW757_012482 [Fusarium falciforme]|nr:hypothetical protein NW757_012482 [Fusarium falciforme]